MKVTASELLARLPGNVTERWPDGERFAQALAHGSMSVELYSPVDADPQSPHAQDELYFVISGTGEFLLEDKRMSFAPGTALFVPAGKAHRFESFTPDFATWVVFWGPQGGER
ncbi:MAG: cupin domain-containing protein [Burkholderiaceae bacterium]|nr:cupin domain-containing protein [Burkholderiaceae bacterium]